MAAEQQIKGLIMYKSLLVVLAAAALPAAATAAAPLAETETVTTSVDYADLALNKRAGAETLDRRVEAAIQSVCARPGMMRDLKAMRAWQECRDTARSQAEEQITPVLAYGEVKVADRF
jgi:UrcA family protein